MFNPSKEQVREFFCQAWTKHQTHQPLSSLQALAIDWMIQHPEYHQDFAEHEETLLKEYSVEKGQTNPFLHISMHLSIAEQMSIDQPSGIRLAVQKLANRLNSLHEAHHEVMEALGNMLWQSQRSGLPPDGQAYLQAIERMATR